MKEKFKMERFIPTHFSTYILVLRDVTIDFEALENYVLFYFSCFLYRIFSYFITTRVLGREKNILQLLLIKVP